ncbi:MAG: SpoIIE family protein phosphatase [Gammaproteobacteria bacterium]|nr:MAG: SpoIIE family protein phosphatase [Gammaproteobacteria bacterium]
MSQQDPDSNTASSGPGSTPREKGGQRLRTETLEKILEVTQKLSAPYDLSHMLEEVIEAARNVLHADRGTVYMYDDETDELLLTVATGMDPIRFPASRGIAGHCARSREIINVPDCYADPRFDPSFDKKTGYRTRCMLTLPLVGYDQSLIGVLQLLNKDGGVFSDTDERVAMALAAQCAVALHRVKLTQELMNRERVNQEISVAREIQMSALPKKMPPVEGYDGAGKFRPADETGGDLFDFVRIEDGRLFLLMGDATGHGIGPALSATQVRAMMRVGLRLGASLDEIYAHTNNQLVDDLPDDRFVTAFVGLLNPRNHSVRFHAGGQGPLLHFRSGSGHCDWYGATTFPMGALQQNNLKTAQRIELDPGDVLALISDGVYEYENPSGEQFGEQRVGDLVREHHDKPMTELIEILLRRVREFGGEAIQGDDITVVVIRRLPH